MLDRVFAVELEISLGRRVVRHVAVSEQGGWIPPLSRVPITKGAKYRPCTVQQLTTKASFWNVKKQGWCGLVTFCGFHVIVDVPYGNLKVPLFPAFPYNSKGESTAHSGFAGKGGSST